MKGIRLVNQPYTNWFASPDELRKRAPDILFIGFQETLTKDFELLKSALDLPTSLTLPSDPLLANRAPSPSVVDLEAEAIYNLKTWYAQDYELFDICKELRKQQDGR